MLDCHIHTFRCGHGEGDFEDYIDLGIKRKFRVLGFSEHAPFIHDQENRMTKQQMKDYFKKLAALRKKYSSNVLILAGLEVDYSVQGERFIREMLSGVKPDFILGAVHFVENGRKTTPIWDFEKMQHPDSQQAYFRQISRAISSDIFDTIAHPELLLRTGIREELLANNFREIIAQMIKKNTFYEINCSGLSKSIYSPDTGEMVPGGYLSHSNIT